MIKPTSLWNFIHECEAEDAEYIGRICLALAGKQVEFSRAEKIQFLTISKDNDDMDERIAEKKEKDRERKKRWKDAEERGGTRKDAEERGMTRNDAEGADSASPSIHPSVHPLQEDDVAVPRTRVRDKTPTIDDVLKFAADAVHHPDGKTYPEDWARGWFVYMEQSDPPWTKDGVQIGSWRQKMITDWSLHQKEARKNQGRINGMPIGVKYQQEGYDASKFGI